VGRLTAPLNPAEVEGEILRLSELLETATKAIRDRALNEGNAYVAYKRTYATALIQIDGRNREEREAKATLASIDELQAHRQAAALLTAAQEAARNLRQQLSSLQSLASNIRHLLVSGGPGVGG
jgi:hypothetical protein